MPGFPCPVFNQELPITQSSLRWQRSLFPLGPSTIYKPQLLPKYKHSPGLYYACYFLQHLLLMQEDSVHHKLFNIFTATRRTRKGLCFTT